MIIWGQGATFDSMLLVVTGEDCHPYFETRTTLLLMSNLKERTNLETLFTDGGYGSPDAYQTLQKNLVKQIQTAGRGLAPNSEKLNLADFEIKQTESGKPTQITCPQQQTMAVHLGSQEKNDGSL